MAGILHVLLRKHGGGTDTEVIVSTESRPWRRKFSRSSCRDSNPRSFSHEIAVDCAVVALDSSSSRMFSMRDAGSYRVSQRARANDETNQPANQPANQTTNHPTNQPTSQPASQPTSQPTNQPTNHPANQPANQPTKATTTSTTTKVYTMPVSNHVNGLE